MAEELMDINTRFGYDPRRGVMTTPEDVKRAGQRWGVVRAYTCSMTAILFDCDEGNQETLDLCARDSFFRPVAVGCPTGPHPRQRVEKAREQGFAMVRLFPEVHGYTVDSPACARLVEVCAEAGLPVMIPTAASGASRVARLLRGREGQFILTNNHYSCLGDLLALAEALPTINADVGEVFTPDGHQVVAEALSVDRMLWGSGYPMLSVGASVSVLRGSGLSPADIARVGAGNARRLLEGGR